MSNVDAEVARHPLETVPHSARARDAVLSRGERLLVLDLAGDVDAIVARRLCGVFERAQFGVHVGTELLGVAETVDPKRGEEMRHAAGQRRIVGQRRDRCRTRRPRTRRTRSRRASPRPYPLWPPLSTPNPPSGSSAPCSALRGRAFRCRPRRSPSRAPAVCSCACRLRACPSVPWSSRSRARTRARSSRGPRTPAGSCRA